MSDKFSTPDSREPDDNFPNDSRPVQDTDIEDVPANPSHPLPVDSRVNPPEDSRKDPHIPLNSRVTP